MCFQLILRLLCCVLKTKPLALVLALGEGDALYIPRTVAILDRQALAILIGSADRNGASKARHNPAFWSKSILPDTDFRRTEI